MNAWILRLQKNSFYLLIPIVVLLSYSIAYVFRSIIILYLPNQQSQQKITKEHRAANNQSIPKSVTAYEETVIGNMIRGALPPVPGKDGAPGEVFSADTPEVEELLLTGTLSGSRSFARATFLFKGREEADEFALEEKVADYIVKEIGQHSVLLMKNEYKLRVEIGESLKQAKLRSTEVKETAAPIQRGNCTVENKRVSRTDFERNLKNPTDIMKGLRTEYKQANGKIEGIKIHEVPQSNVLFQLGARTGDFVQRVNGMPLQDMEKMMEMWTNIKNSTKVTIDLDRRGKCFVYEINITN
ncbi:MAG TPA: general secretion pathway protein GspC [Leptospiraceae bacterium]|nr:general secretion pathway protein GspC [Leptospiraceae bacterium]HNM06718.1 general secretion pathway protein GspC [Leptospiraceae bacterium]HNN02422.1 general secretion pathway protein GspC [Leptospiraceae bacterium]